jgi:hypothetical protein
MSELRFPSRVAVRGSRRTRELLLVALALLGSLVIGRSLASGQIMFAGLVAGFVLVVALAQAPWAPYAACVALVSTFAHPASLPQFGIPGNPTLSDLVLVAAFASWLLLLATGRAEPPSAFPVATQVAVGLFVLAVLGGVIVGKSNGGTFALVEARDVAYYATFWLALSAFANPRGRALLIRLLAVGAVLIVVAQVAQGVLGPRVMLFYDSDPLRELLVCPSGNCPDPWAEGFPRIRPPGLVLVYIAACFSASYCLWGPRRKRRTASAVLVISIVGILISLNRNMLIGLVAGIVLAGLLAARRDRFAVAATIGFVVLAMALSVARASSEVSNGSIASRVLSITAVSQLEHSDTVSLRVRENNDALAVLRSSPIVGIGWAVPFGAPEISFQNGEFSAHQRSFIHNQYLALWLRTGLLGLASFVAALLITLVYGARWLRRRANEEDAWLGAGLLASVTAIGLSSFVAIYVVHPSWAPALAGLMALGTVLQRDLTRDASTDGPTAL